jgi:hypothetical protein
MFTAEEKVCNCSRNNHKQNYQCPRHIAVYSRTRQTYIHAPKVRNKTWYSQERHYNSPHPHYFLNPMRSEPITSISQSVYHLLTILQTIPDFADVVSDVAKIDFLFFFKEGVLFLLQRLHHSNLRTNDAPEADKVSSDY